MSEPPRCDNKVFEKGTPILLADTGEVGGCHLMEEWIVKVRKRSGQKVDWHYSGGIAQVLYLGDREKVVEALLNVPCPEQINKFGILAEGSSGRYREGVTEVSSDAIYIEETI